MTCWSLTKAAVKIPFHLKSYKTMLQCRNPPQLPQVKKKPNIKIRDHSHTVLIHGGRSSSYRVVCMPILQHNKPSGWLDEARHRSKQITVPLVLCQPNCLFDTSSRLAWEHPQWRTHIFDMFWKSFWHKYIFPLMRLSSKSWYEWDNHE